MSRSIPVMRAALRDRIIRLSSRLGLLVILAAAGCSFSGTLTYGDGGSRPDGCDGMGRKMLGAAGDPSRTLHPGDQEELHVLFEEKCIGPVKDATILFEIVNNPGDSSLSSDSADTGDDGLALVVLTAGSLTGDFQVRARHPEVPEGVFFSIRLVPDSCAPGACESLGKECGTWDDGCRGVLDCGECPAGRVCNQEGVCRQAGGDDAAFESQQAPDRVDAGASFDVRITMRNTGTTTWSSQAPAAYKLGSWNPMDNDTWGKKRIRINAGDAVTPGESHTFSATLTAPSEPGVYIMQWRMVNEDIGWFGETTRLVQVEVPDQCDGHCRNGVQDCGETGVDCGGGCGPCTNYPIMRFAPPNPGAGQTVTISISDPTPHVNLRLTGTGPCGAVQIEFVEPVEQDPVTGVYTWNYRAVNLTGGEYDFTFAADNGATFVVSGALAVSGTTNCGDPCEGHCTNNARDCGETGVDCGGGCGPCSDPCEGHCANNAQDCGETGVDCGGECASCGSGGHHIYGIFGWSAGAGGILNGKQGWSVEFLRTEVEWADRGWWNARMNEYGAMISEGFTPITRITFGPSMMPGNQSLCDGAGDDDFTARAADMAVDIRGRHGAVARRFIIGNEPNHPAEGELEAADYVACYLQVHQKIKAAWPQAIVMPAAVAPWAPKDYNCGGNAACAGLDQPWKRYYFGLVAGVGSSADAYDVHSYGGRGGDRDPYDDGDWSFGVFEAAIDVMNRAQADNKPIYITEFNHGADGPAYNYDGSWSGFIQRGFQRINDYNSSSGGRIKSLCWFTYNLQGWEHYNLTAHPQALSDFRSTTANTNYTAP